MNEKKTYFIEVNGSKSYFNYDEGTQLCTRGGNKDYLDDKPYYICRWLNHSFMPFTKKQEQLYKQVREKYNLICKSARK